LTKLEYANIFTGMKLTSKEEDYLETIYRLSLKDGPVGISDVARERDVTLPTVVSAVSRLKMMGLISQRHYGKIVLNRSGRKKAQEIFETHKAIKLFLTDVLCLSQEHSEGEACRLEHVISKETLRRLTAFVETVQKCPARTFLCQDKYLDGAGRNI
jgi:DtxR family Mn-dependent transcriptional regulator